jgi:hypothetical protein
MKGWADHRYQHNIKYNPMSEYHVNKAYGDKYNLHNREEVVHDLPYWETKENDEYYKLSRFQRFKFALKEIKEKVNISKYKDFIYLNLLLMLVLIYYANKKSKQIII